MHLKKLRVGESTFFSRWKLLHLPATVHDIAEFLNSAKNSDLGTVLGELL